MHSSLYYSILHHHISGFTRNRFYAQVPVPTLLTNIQHLDATCVLVEINKEIIGDVKYDPTLFIPSFKLLLEQVGLVGLLLCDSSEEICLQQARLFAANETLRTYLFPKQT